MALDTAQLRPVLLGVPENLLDLPFSSGGVFLFAETVNGPAYGTENLRSRFLRQTARWRVQGYASEARTLAFGPDRSSAGSTAACAVDALALAYTTLPRTARLRLRRVGPAAYNDLDDLWIDQPCATLWSGAVGTFSAATNSRVNLTGALTLSAWVYPTTLDATARRIVTWRSSGATRYPFELAILDTGSGAFLRFSYTHSGGTAASVDSSVSAALGTDKWQQVGVTISGTTLTFIVNGASIGTATLAASTRDAGNGVPEVGAAAPNTFVGRLSDLRVYATAIDYTTYAKWALWKSYAHPGDPYWANLVAWLPLTAPGDPTVHYGQAAADRAAGDSAAMTVTFTSTTSGLNRVTGGTVVDTGWVDAFDQAILTESQFVARRRDAHLVPASTFSVADSATPYNSIYTYQLDIEPNDFGSISPQEIEVGRFVVGSGFQFSANVTDPWKVGVEDPSIVDLADYGQLWYETRETFRAQTLAFDMVPEAEAMQLLEVLRAKGATGELFYIADPTGPTYGLQQSMLVRIAGRVDLESSAGNLWTVTIPVEEVRAG